jgi:hypothetical protein
LLFIVFDGRFELPKPCGARPESVTPPCALQERAPELPVRPELYVEVERELLLPGCVAYGGRLEESSERRPALKAGEEFDMECAIVVLAP